MGSDALPPDPPLIEAPSPNFGPRRGGARPDMVVIHHTAMASAEAALKRLCDRAAEVSCHYLIAEDGRLWRLVAETDRAWHAGAGAWGAVADVNSRSIGIELANAGPLAGHPPFPEPQMVVLERLLDAVMARWAIAPARVIAHSDMAPGRKCDPGPKFDWRRLARAGRAVWPEAARAVVAEFPVHALQAGYVPPAGGWGAVLDAFRLRFRPWACEPGPSDADAALMAGLAAAYPCVDAEGMPT